MNKKKLGNNGTNQTEKSWHNSKKQFRGANYRSIDIQHIYDTHHPKGMTGKIKGNKKTLFPESMTLQDLKKCIIRVWSARKKIKCSGSSILYKGFDFKYNIYVDIRFNRVTKIIETAYPIYPKN